MGFIWDLMHRNGKKEASGNEEDQILLVNKQAELMALQNQINPHFLYNTLDAIRGDALKIGAVNIADVTEALSTYFRYTISRTQFLVSIMEELENVNNYFKIQQYRFEDKLKIEMFIENDSVLRFLCPKLMLQPIVENAIFHGIEKRAQGGLVTIKVEGLVNKVRIIVSDNGVGMSEERLEEINQRLGKKENEIGNRRHGIALLNVNRRIKLLFGKEYGIWIFSVENVGTSINMEIPVIEENSYEKRDAVVPGYED